MSRAARIILRDDGRDGRELAIANGRADGGVTIAPVTALQALRLGAALISWAAHRLEAGRS